MILIEPSRLSFSLRRPAFTNLWSGVSTQTTYKDLAGVRLWGGARCFTLSSAMRLSLMSFPMLVLASVAGTGGGMLAGTFLAQPAMLTATRRATAGATAVLSIPTYLPLL